MLAHHRVVQRAVLQGHLEQAAAGLFHRLLDRHRHFTRLALAHADAAIAVTNHGQRREATWCGRPSPTLLTRLTAIIFFAQAVVVLFLHGVLALCLSHLTDPRLELQAGFTRGIGQNAFTRPW